MFRYFLFLIVFLFVNPTFADSNPQWGLLQVRADSSRAFIPLSDNLTEFSTGNWRCQFEPMRGNVRMGICKSGKNTVSVSATLSNKSEGKSMEWFEAQDNKYYLAWRR